MCGEKSFAPTPVSWLRGSPPRVRGKVNMLLHDACNIGITPACAGKRRKACTFAKANRDHPRVCGEKSLTMQKSKRCRGSPPRVRGKASIFISPLAGIRITPACAGKRSARPSAPASYWDHPRVCGEKVFTIIFSVAIGGSPPRVRGKGCG